MKFLLAGLGNMDLEYFDTRHNIGFDVVDQIAKKENLVWQSDRYVHKVEMKQRGNKIILIKPTTYMNLSGKAIRYWMQAENIPLENVLVILDDLNLDFGKIRIKGEGTDGGHNGLKDISLQLNSTKYPRLRVGIGNSFAKGRQVNFVLGKWTPEELKHLPTIITKSAEAGLSFSSIGLQLTMNQFNSFQISKES